MRRLVALILMLIVPLQFAWSAVAGVHGHMGEVVQALGMHAHDHDHDHAPHDMGNPDTALTPEGGLDTGHGEDGHHASHYHPVFSSILTETGLTLATAMPGAPIPHAPAAFLSRIPPLLDRPPLALA